MHDAAPIPQRPDEREGPEIENPHELLGLSAGEVDCDTIIEAARIRLTRIRACGGSDLAVRRFVTEQIVAAREAMLRTSRVARLKATAAAGGR